MKNIVLFNLEIGNTIVLERLLDRDFYDFVSPAFEWQNQGRKEVYDIFARKIKGKESLREDGFIAFDLDDLQWAKKD